MKQKRLTIIAIACGCVCALCVFAFMGVVQGEANEARAEALARYGGEQIDVCVAARDIAAGEHVDATAVEMKLWVADLLPEGALRDSSEAVGRTATTSILKGEVLSEKRFDQTADMLDVPLGQAAVSLPAKTVQAVGGAVRPGMQVDIYVSGDSGTSLLAEGVQVLATSSDGGNTLSTDASWITVAVDPERVQEIVAAASSYELYFALPGEAPDAVGAGDGSAADEANADTSTIPAGEGAAEAGGDASIEAADASGLIEDPDSGVAADE